MTLDEKIMCFIKKMGYMDNEHVLGILFYGSYLSEVKGYEINYSL